MAMNYRQACQELGVKPSASQEEIKRSYRRLARQLHPDHNPDPAAAERFSRIAEAYRIMGAAAGTVKATIRVPDSAPTHPAASSVKSESNTTQPDLLKGRKPRRVPVDGQDVIGDLYLSIEEVMQGTQATVAFDDLEPCPGCNGQGGAPHAAPVICPACGGSNSRCPWCEGIGRLPSLACSSCHGQGTLKTSREAQMDVSPGVGEGDELTLKGHGRWGAAGSGNLTLVAHVDLPDGLRVEGLDVYQDMPVGILEAVLGGKAQIQLPDGTHTTLQIKPGTSSGRRLRLKGRGIPSQDGTRGDLFAVAMLTAPEQLTDRERVLYEQLLAEAARTP